MPAEKRLGGLDRGRLAGAFLVAAIHISPLAPWTPTGDFLLTRVLARTAVPFFLMITGYFLLPPFLSGGWADWNRLWRYQGRLLALYVGAAALYLPVNLYAGQLRGLDGLGAFRLLAFDGTFYHLWYLPAAMLGVLLTAGLGRPACFEPGAGRKRGAVPDRPGRGQLLEGGSRDTGGKGRL